MTRLQFVAMSILFGSLVAKFIGDYIQKCRNWRIALSIAPIASSPGARFVLSAECLLLEFLVDGFCGLDVPSTNGQDAPPDVVLL